MSIAHFCESAAISAAGGCYAPSLRRYFGPGHYKYGAH